jgi:glycosyltransferase involved in cell wall biosynthesis
MTKNKVLFIMHFPPPVHGAAMVGQFIKDSFIINKRLDTKYVNLSTSKKVKEIGGKPFLKIWRLTGIIFFVLKSMFIFKPDIVYITLSSNNRGFLKDSIIVFLVKIFPCKIIFHFHNKGVKRFKDFKFFDFLYRKVFKKTKSILLSKHLYSDIEQYVNKEDVFYCPNGIPDINFENPRGLKQPRPKVIKILFLSNLIESKGVLVLIEACKILDEDGVDYVLNIVGGDGDILKTQLLDIINDYKLNGKVNYLGKKYGLVKDEVFLSNDIFVFPTFYENECFPLVNLEAMRSKLPIISTNEGGIVDMIEDGITGLFVKKKDAKDLSDKLLTLINNPQLCNEMGEAGRRKFIKEFTLPVFEERLLEILRSI